MTTFLIIERLKQRNISKLMNNSNRLSATKSSKEMITTMTSPALLKFTHRLWRSLPTTNARRQKWRNVKLVPQCTTLKASSSLSPATEVISDNLF